MADELEGTYEDNFGDDCLELKFRDKTYLVPDADADTYKHCLALAKRLNEEGTSVVLEDDEELELYERVLGPVWDELADDGHTGIKVRRRCGLTTFFWVVGNMDVANAFWKSGGDPKALKQAVEQLTGNRETRRSGAKTASSGAPGRTTKPATRGKTTTTRAKTSRSRG